MKFKSILLKSFLIMGGIAFSGLLQAQKTKVVSAYNYNKAFLRDKECDELADGKEAIEKAMEHEKTNRWAKTWYYAGNIYFNIATAMKGKCEDVEPEALTKSVEAYTKALKYNFEDEELKNVDLDTQEGAMKFMMALSNQDTEYDDQAYTADIVGRRFPGLSNMLINKGVEQFQDEKDYKGALESFESSIFLSSFSGKLDTSILYYAGIAAERVPDTSKAIEIYEQLIQVGYVGKEDGPRVHSYLAKLYKAQGKKDKALKVIQKGRDRFPENNALIVEELEYFLQAGKDQEALQNLKTAIEKDPENEVLHYAKGTVHDKLDQTEKAVKSYKKAIELKEDYYDAYFNLGALFYNTGAEWNNKANEYGIDELDKIDAAEAKANENFEKAVPHLEKALELKPGNAQTAQPLLKIYAILGETEKYKALKAEFSN